MVSLILVYCFYTRGSINCSNNSKSFAVVLVKFLKTAQLSILTSQRVFSILFRVSRKSAVQRFRLRFLLCAITTAADTSAFADIFFPHRWTSLSTTCKQEEAWCNKRASNGLWSMQYRMRWYTKRGTVWTRGNRYTKEDNFKQDSFNQDMLTLRRGRESLLPWKK
jgi:hypothetical protein